MHAYIDSLPKYLGVSHVQGTVVFTLEKERKAEMMRLMPDRAEIKARKLKPDRGRREKVHSMTKKNNNNNYHEPLQNE